MSEKRKESSFSRTSKSFSAERKAGKEFPKARSEQASDRSEKSVKSNRSVSKKSFNSPPDQKASQSGEKRKAVKLPIYVVIDGGYYDKISRDGFEVLDKIRTKFLLETMKVDDSIEVPDLKGRVVHIFAANDDDKIEAAEYFVERYLKATDNNDDSASDNSLKILMPEGVVSLFIGAKGKHIKQLMYDTKTKIIVSQPTQTAAFRSLAIQSDAHYIRRSLKKIVETIERLATDKQFHNKESRVRTVDTKNSRVMAKIVIEDEIVTHLYNKRDNIIRNIIKDFNVGIKVVEPNRGINLRREDRVCVR